MKTSTPALVNESKERASPKKRLETEYLILGSGATGIAFVNKILIQGTTDRITLLDKHAQPGGHRNDTNAYASLHPTGPWPITIAGVGRDPLVRTFR